MNIATLISEIGKSLLDFVYPQLCPACGIRLEKDVIVCRPCRFELEEKALLYADSTLTVENTDHVVVLFPYDVLSRTLIHDLKYHGRPEIGILLGELLGESIHASMSGKDALVVPVPLHSAKLKSRGYNQSERLATGIAQVTGLTIDESLIVRLTDSGTQTALSAVERIKNVSGAFEFVGKAELTGRDVILVDDVLTTGSTISECAKVLKDGGAGSVTVCVAATPGLEED